MVTSDQAIIDPYTPDEEGPHPKDPEECFHGNPFLHQIIDFWLGPELLLEAHDMGRANQLRDQTFRIIRIPEVGRYPEASRHASRKHPSIQPVEAELALPDIAHRGLILRARPRSTIFR